MQQNDINMMRTNRRKISVKDKENDFAEKNEVEETEEKFYTNHVDISR